MKVLAVDDTAPVLELMNIHITELGHEAVLESDGVGAKARLIRGEKFDAIMTDNRMPVMGGVEFLEWFKTKFGSADDTILILTSALFNAEAKALGQKYLDIHLLDKPWTIERLRQLLTK